MALIEVQPAKVYWAITAATSNISSRSGLSLTIGGIAVDTDGMRVLLTNQTNPMENGIWIARSGAWDQYFPSTKGNTAVYVRKGTNRGIAFSADWDAGEASSWWIN